MEYLMVLGNTCRILDHGCVHESIVMGMDLNVE